MLQLIRSGAKSGLVLGKACAEAVEGLARQASALHIMFGERAQQIRDGKEFGDKQNENSWSKRVREATTDFDKTPTDAFSKDFEQASDALVLILKPHL
jgi:hypothetical protein